MDPQPRVYFHAYPAVESVQHLESANGAEMSGSIRMARVYYQQFVHAKQAVDTVGGLAGAHAGGVYLC